MKDHCPRRGVSKCERRAGAYVSVPFVTCWRSLSPLEMCAMSNVLAILEDTVPLPEAGAPRITALNWDKWNAVLIADREEDDKPVVVFSLRRWRRYERLTPQLRLYPVPSDERLNIGSYEHDHLPLCLVLTSSILSPILLIAYLHERWRWRLISGHHLPPRTTSVRDVEARSFAHVCTSIRFIIVECRSSNEHSTRRLVNCDVTFVEYPNRAHALMEPTVFVISGKNEKNGK